MYYYHWLRTGAYVDFIVLTASDFPFRAAPSSKAIRLTSSANANSFFDNIIPNLQTFVVDSSLDPMPLPEMDAEVWRVSEYHEVNAISLGYTLCTTQLINFNDVSIIQLKI